MRHAQSVPFFIAKMHDMSSDPMDREACGSDVAEVD